MEQNILNEILVIVKRTDFKVGKMDKRIVILEKDVKILKQDVAELKQEMKDVKQDVAGLKQKVNVLTESMNILKEEIKREISSDIGKILNEIMIIIAKVESEKQEKISNQIEEHEKKAIKGVELLKQSLVR